MNETDTNETVYRRFCVLHRFLHLVTMVGFAGLALTGMTIAFGSQGWAKAVAFVLGGAGGVGALHRICAVATYGCVVVHVFWLLYFKWRLGGRLTGPQSMFPRIQDVKDLFQHIGYFFGRRQVPRFNRFTYWEKIDYLALFLGMNTMGLTGLVLWFPESFARIMPGYFINLAQILHFYEAVMAVALKFVVHIVSAHLRPVVYPVDKSIFNGLTSAEKMRHEHPGEWEALHAEG